MKHTILWIAGVFAAASTAQDKTPIGGFENQGSVTLGYRFTDVTGYQPKYTELFGLNSGFRLMDFSLFGNAKEGKSPFADNYSLTMTGLGGEPFTTAQFTMRKTKLYDLRIDYRQSYYYWNRNDQALLPNGLDGLTSNHDWSTVWKNGNIDFLIHATNDLRFSVDYNRNTRSGATFTTRTPDFFGSPASWGAFARANPYYLFAPVDEAADRITGGADYTHGGWSVHYHAGYQHFTDGVNGQNLVSPLRSINIDDPTTARQLLNSFTWQDNRKLNTPISEFSYTGKALPWLELRGSYTYYRYSGPASLNIAFNGTALAPIGPYNISEVSNATVSEPNHVLNQGFTFKIKDWWSVMLDYQYFRFSVNADGNFTTNTGTPALTGSPVITGSELNQWRIGASTADLNLLFTPAASLLIRPGVRFVKNDVEFEENNLIDNTRTKRIKSVWPVLSAYYQPSKKFSIRGDVDQVLNGTSYTAITPHTDFGGRIVARYRPIDNFYIEDTFAARDRKLLATDFHSTVWMNAATVTYDFNQRFSVLAGFSYDSFFAEDFANFVRGTPPLVNVSMRDQTVNRVWQGGLRVYPVNRLQIEFTGNYVRTTGTGQIAGEPPYYGPLTFPYATGLVGYDFPKVGRLAVQLQRTYYIEQIVTGNNFSANLLTLLWTRSF
jgi:hypothetical protein